MNSGTGIYKSGVLAFLAGAILIGALLGAVTFCFMGSDELSMLSVFSNSFVDVRSSGDLEEILVRSFFSSTVFLAVVFLSGFSSLGQPLAVAVLLLRGMGWGKGARRKVPLPPDAPAQGALEAYALRHDVL